MEKGCKVEEEKERRWGHNWTEGREEGIQMQKGVKWKAMMSNGEMWFPEKKNKGEV